MERLRIDDIDVFLENLGEGKGKITISDSSTFHNYAYYWGSLGGTLQEFLCHINGGYFADKLMGARRNTEMDIAKTFAVLRKHIASEFYLPWYKHQDFQKEMRSILREFQDELEERPSADRFVDNFKRLFVDRLSFYYITDRHDRERLEKEFKGMSEVWNFIVDRPSKEYMWLCDFHKKLKKMLKKEMKPERSVATKADSNQTPITK